MKLISKQNGFDVFSDTEQSVSVNAVDNKAVKIYRFKFEKAGNFKIEFFIPCAGVYYLWHPNCKTSRIIPPDWAAENSVSINNSAPIVCLYDNNDINSYTFACSELCGKICFSFGINEYTGSVKGTVSGESRDDLSLFLYIDEQKREFYKAVRDVGVWWENGLAIMPVPNAAYMPVYSSWYVFHQSVCDERLESECKTAAELGMKTVIVDDGWHTRHTIDISGDYSYCGDWQVSEEKFKNMKQHVKKLHSLGMKYMMWFGVPFIGINSDGWDSFSDKLLYTEDNLHAGILDPRYPSVRERLTVILEDTLKKYDIDGFKLDFLDRFHSCEHDKACAEMDYTNVEDAVFAFLSGLRQRLCLIKPDVLIEFRQFYAGPCMRSFCNMLRVADCPNDFLSNRIGIADLRLLSGSTAVHSDMLMWSSDETNENAALYIINSMFSVIQLSVNLSKQSSDKIKMIKFWLEFVSSKRDVILCSEFIPYSPALLYPLIKAQRGKEAVIGVYAKNQIVCIDGYDRIFIANATADSCVYLSCTNSNKYRACSRNCMGEIASDEVIAVCGVVKVAVPLSGLLELRAI